MRRLTVLCVALAGGILAAACGPAAAAAPKAPRPPRRGTAVLDTFSYWRCYVALRPVLFGTARAARPDPKGRIAPDFGWRRGPTLAPGQPNTPLPPPDWTRPDFDDGRWWRDPGPFFGNAEYQYSKRLLPHHSRYGISQPSTLALLCARGKFTVTDPAQVKSLHLSVEFRGGLVVYLNGREVARRFLRKGPIDPLTLAEDYPLEASLDPRGRMLDTWRPRGETLRRLELRVRRADDIALPVAALRKGVNVLALEIHRAAMPTKTLDVSRRGRGRNRGWFWNTVGLLEVRLTAEGSGIVPNVARPKGVQVWNANPLESIFASDYGDPNEVLRPVRIVAARNGAFAGQVVVSADRPLRGLRAEVSGLVRADGRGSLPRTAVTLRYPRRTVVEPAAKRVFRTRGTRTPPPLRFEALDESPPAVVEVPNLPRPSWRYAAVRGKLGAVQPVWITVRVPADAAPGAYRGTLAIHLAGRPLAAVPVEVVVHDFRLPDPQDFRTWVDFIETPEALAAWYKVPLWSEKHWALIERSMRFLAAVRNKTLYVPLLCGTNFANRESMVRWVGAGKDRAGRPDFRRVERYLDLARKAGIQPQVVCFVVWDYHIGRNTRWKLGTGMYEQTSVNTPQPVPVTAEDPATGRVWTRLGPRYGTPEAEAFWRPVAEGIAKLVKERGLERALMLGLAGDYVPPKEVVALWARLLPGAPWVTMAHGGTARLYHARVGYRTTVFGAHHAIDPELRRSYGWRRRERAAFFPRYPWRFSNRCLQIPYDRLLFEMALQANLRGAGRLSLDAFVFPHRNPKCNWGSLSLRTCWLAPGPDGPVSTVRFEMGREGIQECEARIFLERALTDEKLRATLGPALAARCQALLDERQRCLILANEKSFNGIHHTSMPGGPLGHDWYAGSDWQGRSEKLYAAAAEVAARLARN